MRILALEPYHGGSHKAFLDGWTSRSGHEWTVIGLPPYRWKWRMRHAGYTLAAEVEVRMARGESWDLLLCSDMLNLPEFLGLAPAALRALPVIAYFHENQLTYPDEYRKERDLHYGLVNLLTALAADAVWFNSRYNLDSFLEAIPGFLQEMPDHPPSDPVGRIRAKASILSPGIDPFPLRPSKREPGPLHILWAARWEHDKDPETFFQAMRFVHGCGLPFRLSVAGQVFNRVPPVFDQARHEFREHLEQWGYVEDRGSYRDLLLRTDVFVSTAIHEFFGITAAEAVAAGNYPLFPRRLSYPELLAGSVNEAPPAEFFYDGDALSLADHLLHLIARFEARDDVWKDDPDWARRAVERFYWDVLVPRLDSEAEAVATTATRRNP